MTFRKLVYDIFYFGSGFYLIAFGIFQIIRDIVEFDRYILILPFLGFVLCGCGIIYTRLDERKDEQ